MQTLGTYLQERGLISAEQLGEALQCQAVFGGRLGTNLVELGYMSLEDLARLLGVRAGLPVAPVEWLESPQPDALEIFPRELCEQMRVLPLRVDDTTVHVAMMDPTDGEQLAALSTQAGKLELKSYVVPELRMYVWLERHLGVRRQIRFARLGRQYSRGPHGGTLVGGPTEQPADPRTERLQALGMQPLGLGEELTEEGTDLQAGLEAAVATAPVQERTPVPLEPTPLGGPEEVEGVEIIVEEAQLPELELSALQPVEIETNKLLPPTSSTEVVQLEQALESAPDRDTVAELALRLARGHAQAAALFVVNKGMLQGWRGAGDALDGQDIGGILLPASAECCLRDPALNGQPWRGRGLEGDINARLLKALGRRHPSEAAAFPIKIRGRVVNVLYVDNGPDPLGSTAYAALGTLADRIGVGYENVILERKRGGEKETQAAGE